MNIFHVRTAPTRYRVSLIDLDDYEAGGGLYNDAGNGGEVCTREEFVAALAIEEAEDGDPDGWAPTDDLLHAAAAIGVADGDLWRDSATGWCLLRDWPAEAPLEARCGFSESIPSAEAVDGVLFRRNGKTYRRAVEADSEAECSKLRDQYGAVTFVVELSEADRDEDPQILNAVLADQIDYALTRSLRDGVPLWHSIARMAGVDAVHSFHAAPGEEDEDDPDLTFTVRRDDMAETEWRWNAYSGDLERMP